jgi:hypothetical protein
MRVAFAVVMNSRSPLFFAFSMWKLAVQLPPEM